MKVRIATPSDRTALPIEVWPVIIPKRPHKQPVRNSTCPEGAGALAPCAAVNRAVKVIGCPKVVLEVLAVRLNELANFVTVKP